MKTNFSNISLLDNISLGGFRVDKRTIEAKFLRQRYNELNTHVVQIRMKCLNIPLALAGLRFKDLSLFHNININ